MADATLYRGYEIPAATGAAPAGAAQIRALGRDVDADVAALLRGMRLLQAPVVFTSSGTFTKADYPGLVAVEVEVVGGGGGSAFRQASSASQVAVAQSGSGGGYSYKFILASALASGETVTIGAGGTGATSSGSSGSGGGDTSFGTGGGTHCKGGGGTSASDNVLGTNTSYNTLPPPKIRMSGIGTLGHVNNTGTDPTAGFASTSATYGGSAGSFPSKPGMAFKYGAEATAASYIGGFDSIAGIGYGSGAVGGIKIGSGSNNNGSDGSGGICVVRLYVSNA